jgi:hypothetical protein
MEKRHEASLSFIPRTVDWPLKKTFPRTNTLAYFAQESLTKKESFKTSTPGFAVSLPLETKRCSILVKKRFSFRSLSHFELRLIQAINSLVAARNWSLIEVNQMNIKTLEF